MVGTLLTITHKQTPTPRPCIDTNSRVMVIPEMLRLPPGEKVVLDARGFAGAANWRIEPSGEGGGLKPGPTQEGRATPSLAQPTGADALAFRRDTSRSRPHQTAMHSVHLHKPAARLSTGPRRLKFQGTAAHTWNPFQFLDVLIPLPEQAMSKFRAMDDRKKSWARKA